MRGLMTRTQGHIGTSYSTTNISEQNWTINVFTISKVCDSEIKSLKINGTEINSLVNDFK